MLIGAGARLARRLGVPPLLVGLTVVSIGTSGAVYPAAGFVLHVRRRAPRARTVELNLEATGNQPLFLEHIYGPATEVVPRYVERVLAGRWQY